MGFIDTWGPILDDAEQLYREARDAREAGRRSHDGSYGFMREMTDEQLRAACLGAAIAIDVATARDDDQADSRRER